MRFVPPAFLFEMSVSEVPQFLSMKREWEVRPRGSTGGEDYILRNWSLVLVICGSP